MHAYYGTHWNVRLLAFAPTAGELGGQLLNSQPLEPTGVGGESDDPVPDLFSAGAESTTYKLLLAL